jgi:hypothetical protein
MQYMAREKLFYTLNLGQALLGTLVPLILLGVAAACSEAKSPNWAAANILCQRRADRVGVLAMRWNVVIGGQLFSKSLRGVMSYTNGVHRHGRVGSWLLPFVAKPL